MDAKPNTRTFTHIIILFVLSFFVHTAYASQLPAVTGANYDGERISWDSMLGATGYNIYLEFEYLDTVTGSTLYVPGRRGEYRIAAFDSSGRFSPLEVINSDVVPTSNVAVVDSLPDEVIIIDPPILADQLPAVSGANFDGSAITWDSLSGASGYNIYLDFEYLDTVVEGISYIPALAGEYRIAAFDDEGRYSPLQVIDADVVRTGNIAIVDFDSDGPIDQPTTPQNVSLSIYSQTAAELFWDRSSLAENIVMTEIFRNDVLLGVSPGNSFYDDSRIAGSMYRYELIAINSSGERSLPAIVNPDALDGDVEEAVLSLMSGISDVTNNNPHIQWFSILRNLTFTTTPLVLLSTDTVLRDDLITLNISTYICDAGSPGRLTIDEIDSRFGIHILDFDNCSIDGVAFDGGLSIVGTDIGGYNASYQDLEILAGDNPTYITGEVSSSVGRGLNFTSLTYTDFNYSIIGNLIDEDGLDTSVVLNQEVTDYIFSEVRNTLTTNFSVFAPWTRGESVEVVTTEQFTGADLGEGNFLTGELTVLSTSGDSVIVSADTGSAESWSASVNVGDDNFTVDGTWAETGKLPCVSVTTGESALTGCFER